MEPSNPPIDGGDFALEIEPLALQVVRILDRLAFQFRVLLFEERMLALQVSKPALQVINLVHGAPLSLNIGCPIVGLGPWMSMVVPVKMGNKSAILTEYLPNRRNVEVAAAEDETAPHCQHSSLDVEEAQRIAIGIPKAHLPVSHHLARLQDM